MLGNLTQTFAMWLEVNTMIIMCGISVMILQSKAKIGPNGCGNFGLNELNVCVCVVCFGVCWCGG